MRIFLNVPSAQDAQICAVIASAAKQSRAGPGIPFIGIASSLRSSQ